MKKMLFLAAALLFSAAVFAQKSDKAIRPETAKLVEKYGLDLAQTAKMDDVMAKKAKNLAAIEPMKTANPEKYRTKLFNVLKGTRASEARILNTKAQKEIHRQMLVEIRTRRAAKEAELKKQNATKEVLENAFLEIEGGY